MKKILGRMILMLCLLLFPLSVQAGTVNYYKTTSAVNIRKGPGTSYKKVALLSKNTIVHRTGTKKGWAKITWKKKTRYIKASYLKASSIKLYVNGSSVNVRKKCTTSSGIVTNVKYGTKIKVKGEKDGWYYVVANGKKGYIRKDLLSSSAPKAPATSKPATNQSTATSGNANALIQAAQRHLGDKYSQKLRDEPGYADCSSLIRDIFQEVFHVYIGNNTTEQIKYLANYKKAFDNLQAGDVLMHVGNDGNHVGLYIGGGKFIHTSSVKGGVVISNYYRDYWTYCYDAIRYCNEHR